MWEKLDEWLSNVVMLGFTIAYLVAFVTGVVGNLLANLF